MATYIVVAGDTLSGIARRYGMTWRELYEHPNNEPHRCQRSNPNSLYPGDELWIPDDPESEPGVRRPDDDDVVDPRDLESQEWLIPYKVRNGDSIASIAEERGLDWQEIALLNWNTDVPEEINWYLGTYFACTVKKGCNYVFSSSDEPGILYLPPAHSNVIVPRRRVLRAARWVKEAS